MAGAEVGPASPVGVMTVPQIVGGASTSAASAVFKLTVKSAFVGVLFISLHVEGDGEGLWARETLRDALWMGLVCLALRPWHMEDLAARATPLSAAMVAFSFRAFDSIVRLCLNAARSLRAASEASCFFVVNSDSSSDLNRSKSDIACWKCRSPRWQCVRVDIFWQSTCRNIHGVFPARAGRIYGFLVGNVGKEGVLGCSLAMEPLSEEPSSSAEMDLYGLDLGRVVAMDPTVEDQRKTNNSWRWEYNWNTAEWWKRRR